MRLRKVLSVAVDAGAADEYRRPGDELLDLLLGSLTKRTAERLWIHPAHEERRMLGSVPSNDRTERTRAGEDRRPHSP